MQILDVTDARFKKYGRIVKNVDFTGLVEAMQSTPLPDGVEYHRSSEINVAATDAVLILGSEQDITDDFHYDTSLMEAFKIPKGTAVEIYGTTLHYAPCDLNNEGFKVTVVLPKGTNEPLDEAHKDDEDKLITAKNKWLIAHAEGGQDPAAFIGLVGKNLNINE